VGTTGGGKRSVRCYTPHVQPRTTRGAVANELTDEQVGPYIFIAACRKHFGTPNGRYHPSESVGFVRIEFGRRFSLVSGVAAFPAPRRRTRRRLVVEATKPTFVLRNAAGRFVRGLLPLLHGLLVRWQKRFVVVVVIVVVVHAAAGENVFQRPKNGRRRFVQLVLLLAVRAAKTDEQYEYIPARRISRV